MGRLIIVVQAISSVHTGAGRRRPGCWARRGPGVVSAEALSASLTFVSSFLRKCPARPIPEMAGLMFNSIDFISQSSGDVERDTYVCGYR